MTRRWFTLRLEPRRPAGDPERGFPAEIGDPAWFLGRQWQLGEHQGENASSPIDVGATLRRVPIEPTAARPGDDPAVVPAEVIVEDEPDSWWTIGRRLRLGLAARDAGLVGGPGAADGELLFQGLTGPYERLNRVAYDGRAVHRAHPLDGVPDTAGADAWRTDGLGYQLDLPVGDAVLSVGGRDDPATGAWVGHDGGDVDWWSVDADQPVSTGGGEVEHRWPERFTWPGGPARRWWQIEDRAVDLGGYPPDRGHFASVLLLDLLFGHGDDWFLVPLPTRAGHVLAVDACEVTDSFGDGWPLIVPPDAGAPARPPWTLFEVAGLGPRQLPIWLTALSPLAGDPIEQVIAGQDEDANLVWAVEERVDGKATERAKPLPPVTGLADDTGPPVPPPTFSYQPATTVPDHWHPYTREVAADGSVVFRQGRLVAVGPDGTPERRDPPTARLLDAPGEGLHTFAPWRLPPTGVRLERRPFLARATDGRPVLWVQRRRGPLLSMPSSTLRFDALAPRPD